MRVKIQGGTALNGEASLCVSCRYATIVRGVRLSDEIVHCEQLSGHRSVTFPVLSCSGYSDKRRPSVHEMEEIAWILRTDPRKGEIGFVRASALKTRERYVLEED